MDEGWKKQLRSKGGFIAMIIPGYVFSFFAFWGLILSLVNDLPGLFLVCFIVFLACLFLIIRGSIGMASVARHNRRVEEEHLAEVNAAKTAEMLKNSNTSPPTASNSTADEIIKYRQLLENKIITPEEFEAKKKKLLGL